MPEGERKGKVPKELQKETPKDGPKGLGEGEYLSAADWIKRTRAGGSAKKPAPQLNYDEQDTLLLQPEQEEVVAGNLRVLHRPEDFAQGTEHILHLKDVPILDEKGRGLNEEEDALENPGLLEDELRKFKQKSTKKAYDVYADLEGRMNSILPQYDDETLEFKRNEFRLDATGDKGTPEELQAIRNKLQDTLGTVKAEVKGEGKVLYHLEPMEFGIKVQSDYQTAAEAVQFKKVRRADRPSRKKLFDLVAELEADATPGAGENHSSRQLSLKAERDAERALQALQAKERSYRLAKQKAEEARAAVKEIATSALREDDPEPAPERMENEDENGNIVFDPTEEFAKNIASTDDDFFSRQRRRQELMANNRLQEKEADSAGWAPAAAKPEGRRRPTGQRAAEAAAPAAVDPLEQHRRNLEEVQAFHEPKAGGSLADALKLIQQKGWITREYSGRQNDRVVDLRVNDPAPQINIERKDETGREMTQKEAFRRLSHKFHGKAPGKLKQEKKIKRFREEKTLTSMDATDTPLGSLKALQNAQQVTRSPFVVVQGGGTDHMGLAPLTSKKDKRKSDDQVGGSESTMAKRIRH
nr:U4/U6.U5 tri-snRNP-associated 110 kDa protein [Euglena gracilis]